MSEEKTVNVTEEKEKKLCVHFTHNDADALGCTIIQAFNMEYNTQTIFCSYKDHDADNKIFAYFQNENNPAPHMVLITDLIIEEDTAHTLEQMRDYLAKEYGHEMKLLLVDHHISNRLMQTHDWCIVKDVDPDGIPMSAAKLMFIALGAQIDPAYFAILTSFAEKISRYDTWEWKRHPSETMDEEYTNILIQELGIEKAVEKLYPCIKPDEFILTDELGRIIENYIAKRSRALAKIVDGVGFLHRGEYRIAVTIPDKRYYNESLEILYQTYDVDFVMGLVPETKSISLRTDRDDVNLARFAERLFGGGGHKQAAGAKLNTEDFLDLLKEYYESIDLMEKMEEDERRELEAMKNQPRFTLTTANDHAYNAAVICRDKKLTNPSLVFQTLIDEHLRPALMDVLAENDFELSSVMLAFVRGLMSEWYNKYEIIREEVNVTYGSLENFLGQFYIQIQDADGNPIEEEPEVVDDIPLDNPGVADYEEVNEEEEEDESDESGRLEDGPDNEEEEDSDDEGEEVVLNAGGGNDDDSDDVSGLPEDGILYEDFIGALGGASK